MKRAYYSDSISSFQSTSSERILGTLAQNNEFSLEQTQRDSWFSEINILKKTLNNYDGAIYLEYSIPRMGQRIDAVVIIKSIIFVLEFKVGEKKFNSYALDQVMDYALDLKNFHESSHNKTIAPILIATEAKDHFELLEFAQYNDKLLKPIKSDTKLLREIIEKVLQFCDGVSINHQDWENGRYSPTPTIIEAAMVLYNNHSVKDISRNDASEKNLSRTSESISQLIKYSREQSKKSLCFVTGVPGAGKTLVGLNVATKHIDKSSELHSVFLSGNGPLVAILREALVRDKVEQNKKRGVKIKKYEARSEIKLFIQNVHNFRDECLIDESQAPVEHVALFDEAQRAWNLAQTSSFMKRKKNKSNFNKSEPEFLISCLDRHEDWAVIVCLVGGGQEIHTGEAGIGEWLESLKKSFTNWEVYISSRLTDSEYSADKSLKKLDQHLNIKYSDDLHLAVSMRSFRAEKVSLLIKLILDLNIVEAKQTQNEINLKYPIVITRDLTKAKDWLRERARGSERYGLVVSSQAERLKPQGIFVKSPINPIHYFLNGKDDVRSSYYLEDVATEFHIQGLELDWVCVTWDADLRYVNNKWQFWSFKGDRWTNIRKHDRQVYLKNAYRVLLTRARQGMVIVVPNGDHKDLTRPPEYYDNTFELLKEVGFKILE